MPVSRLVIAEPFEVGEFSFYPAGEIDLDSLQPKVNQTLEDTMRGIESASLSGQVLREISTSLTAFRLGCLDESALVVFPENLDQERFSNGSHRDDIAILQWLSARVERALDVVRFDFCDLFSPSELPGVAGSWKGSGGYLGALLHSHADKQSFLIAGDAVECSAVVKGIGLLIDTPVRTPLPITAEGEVAGFVIHALTLFSDAMTSPNETMKFIRCMTLLEFLATPDGYRGWKKLKGDIACHCARDKASYLRICERFQELTSLKDGEGVERGLRTLLVHQGRLIPELIPDTRKRRALFRELQGYIKRVIGDMIECRAMTWAAYCDRRARLKQALGVAT